MPISFLANSEIFLIGSYPGYRKPSVQAYLKMLEPTCKFSRSLTTLTQLALYSNRDISSKSLSEAKANQTPCLEYSFLDSTLTREFWSNRPLELPPAPFWSSKKGESFIFDCSQHSFDENPLPTPEEYSLSALLFNFKLKATPIQPDQNPPDATQVSVSLTLTSKLLSIKTRKDFSFYISRYNLSSLLEKISPVAGLI